MKNDFECRHKFQYYMCKLFFRKKNLNRDLKVESLNIEATGNRKNALSDIQQFEALMQWGK